MRVRMLGLVLALAAAFGATARAATPPLRAVNAPVRTIHTALGRVEYRALGHGRPLVLIMGLYGSIDAWPPSFLDALARRHRVIAIDNEGIGRSTLRPGPLSIPRMADDTAAFIAAMHLRRPDVLGWSMGGFITQALAVRHPGAIRRIVLAATAPGNGHALPPTQAVLKVLTGGLAGLLADLFPPDQSQQVARFTSALAAYRGIELASASVGAAQLAASTAWIAGQDPSGRRLARIRVPTLIGDGADDVILPAANSRILHRAIRGSALALYPDAGHGFLFQDAGAWVKRIERFLSLSRDRRHCRGRA